MTWSSGDPNQQFGQPNQQFGRPAPPPMPYQNATGPPPLTPKKSRTGLIVALVALGVVAALAVAAVAILLLQREAKATEVKVGDCITDVPDASHVLRVPTIDCAQPHAGEVYAILQVPDGPFPGDAKIDEYKQQCPHALKEFTGKDAIDESITVFVLYPTADTWERGDRAVTCIATLDPKRSGSLRG